ncbi:hypothetical protein FQA39_LY13811 [Lamprigera yunnana]|nr:hypothetical protein FQA39_LY13811 [Lamprigera yunnana]
MIKQHDRMKRRKFTPNTKCAMKTNPKQKLDTNPGTNLRNKLQNDNLNEERLMRIRKILNYKEFSIRGNTESHSPASTVKHVPIYLRKVATQKNVRMLDTNPGTNHKNKLQNDNVNEKRPMRIRKIHNYKEFSIRGSTESRSSTASTVKHIPIYLRKIATHKNVRKDPFEFFEEFPKEKNSEDSDSSSTYERSIQEVVRHLRNKDKRKRKNLLHKKILNRNFKTNKVPPKIDKNKKASDEKAIIVTSTPATNLPLFETEAEMSKNENQRAIVISNVTIPPPLSRSPSPMCSSESDFSYGDNFPDYNNQSMSSPWRGDDLNLRRNPHWLVLKDTSLPYYNQEMILEPKLVEQSITIDRSINKENSFVQTTLSDFVTRETISPPKTNASSFFDEHILSPIKVKKKKKKFFNENNFTTLRPKKNENAEKANRKILAPFNENSIYSENVQKIYTVNVMNEEDKENILQPLKQCKDKTALPMRVNLSELKKVQKEAAEQLLEKVLIEDALRDSLPIVEMTETEEDMPHIGLFEELRPPLLPSKTYTLKKRRKLKVGFMDEDKQVNDNPKKKKKEYRTEAEEQAFKEWAASFNAMCEEVEQHTLEIEFYGNMTNEVERRIQMGCHRLASNNKQEVVPSNHAQLQWNQGQINILNGLKKEVEQAGNVKLITL